MTKNIPIPIDWQKKLVNHLRKQNNNYEGHDTNPHDNTFHASSVGYCKRQLYLNKCNLSDMDNKGLRIVNIGSLLHFKMEKIVEEMPDHIKSEKEIPPVEKHGVKLIGTADAVDMEQGVVYDFKTRGGWYKFNPPTKRHLSQLQVYMEGFDIDYGQIVYISRKDFSMNHYPDIDWLGKIPTNSVGNSAYILRDENKLKEITDKCNEVMDLIEEHGVAKDMTELNKIVPRCGCYICNVENINWD